MTSSESLHKNVNIDNSRIWLRITSLYVILHITFWVLLGRITAFGIDEDGYLDVFRKVYSSSFDVHSQLSWPTNSKFLLQVIYLPAKVISLLGLPDYLALRIESGLLFYITCWIIFRQISNANRKLNISIIVVFMFLPSVFIWTSLGLRESYIFFWITLIWLSFHKLMTQKSRKFLLLLTLGVNGLATTKIYLHALILVMAIFVLLFSLRSKGYKDCLLAILVVMSPIFVLPGVQGELLTGARGLILSETISASSEGGALSSEGGASSGLTAKLFILQVEENQLLKSILSQLGLLARINSGISTQDPAKNAFTLSTNFESGSLANLEKFMRAAARFLLLPIPFAENGSFIIDLQSMESPALYLSYFVLLWHLYMILKRRPQDPQIFFGLCVFSLFFIIQSALVEVNLGTLVRHRSILLLLIVLACTEANIKLSKSRTSHASVKP